jgi:hypothetical protein
MTTPAYPRRAATPDPVVTFTVDHDAQPGDVVPVLASLLINLYRQRQGQGQAGDGQQGGNGHE